MSVGRVVRHFQGAGKVPIDLKEVLEVIREIAPDEHIETHGVDVDPGRMKGNCYRYRLPPLEGSALVDTRHAIITYSTRADLKEQRLVCCKELIHILDPDPILTRTQAQVIALSDNMASRKLLRPTTGDDLQAFLDGLAIWQAASMLFPYAFWEELMPKFRAGLVNVATISDWVQIPEDFVEEMMRDEWASMRNLILAYA